MVDTFSDIHTRSRRCIRQQRYSSELRLRDVTQTARRVFGRLPLSAVSVMYDTHTHTHGKEGHKEIDFGMNFSIRKL